MITGINHLTLTVQDLDRSFDFYQNTLGFKPLLKHPRGAYFLAGDLWFCLELASSVPSADPADDTHFAFSVEKTDFAFMAKRIRFSGAIIWKKINPRASRFTFWTPMDTNLNCTWGIGAAGLKLTKLGRICRSFGSLRELRKPRAEGQWLSARSVGQSFKDLCIAFRSCGKSVSL
jgi:catechol 2,3-dioxygenase-like lactoylglutathione lyase family enzyme